ncbi:hypothetical protein NDU88_002206 [Pleurodeles waltl]|uniref:Uncharacterized protein n=1 Tax=Pleurodeles waltl TaxID=8319 RepID=A0AAV7VYR0_PLEWA|nr:hypothetical protein NDU88_002206 [Pleurodeles waltl]
MKHISALSSEPPNRSRRTPARSEPLFRMKCPPNLLSEEQGQLGVRSLHRDSESHLGRQSCLQSASL